MPELIDAKEPEREEHHERHQHPTIEAALSETRPADRSDQKRSRHSPPPTSTLLFPTPPRPPPPTKPPPATPADWTMGQVVSAQRGASQVTRLPAKTSAPQSIISRLDSR